ncbi:MAG: TetR/AcrR family transcriptional regulator [Balneolaceae bacterium]|nr:TetR/AcrR family transcriptional regulator [Balneolaceae bacterium]
MGADTKDTEDLIFEAACRVFQQKGYEGARMQEIADEADINKSMLHYYYRSKDKLFEKVYQREMNRFFPVIFGVLNTEKPLDEKVKELIDAYYGFLRKNPHLAQFIIYEMNQKPQRLHQFMKGSGFHPPETFFRQIEQEISEGNMDRVDPRQLLSSIVGMILFPFLAEAMIRAVLKLDDEAFRAFMDERKEFLLNFILNGINYRRT